VPPDEKQQRTLVAAHPRGWAAATRRGLSAPDPRTAATRQRQPTSQSCSRRGKVTPEREASAREADLRQVFVRRRRESCLHALLVDQSCHPSDCHRGSTGKQSRLSKVLSPGRSEIDMFCNCHFHALSIGCLHSVTRPAAYSMQMKTTLRCLGHLG